MSKMLCRWRALLAFCMTGTTQPLSNVVSCVYLQTWSIDESCLLNNCLLADRAHWLLSNNSNALPVLRQVSANVGEKTPHVWIRVLSLSVDPVCFTGGLLALTAEQFKSFWHKWNMKTEIKILINPIPIFFYFRTELIINPNWRINSHYGMLIKQLFKT